MKNEQLRKIPKIDEVLTDEFVVELLEKYPRRIVVEAIRTTIDLIRASILSEKLGEVPEREELLMQIDRCVKEALQFNLRPVINGSGIIIHTNLGRSLLSEEIFNHVKEVSTHYTNLEYDIEAGGRGLRYSHVEGLIQKLTGAEAALVVNNNAAAVMLALSALAYGKEIVVSRGELVEIGGSFRIPEVMKISGATLVEVGTTNKTHLKDYQNVLGESTGAILKVHTSNYKIVGFTKEVMIDELIVLGKEKDIPVVFDLGSGTLLDLTHFGLSEEPTVLQQINRGVDVLTFSGDKLLGGPQAGIIVGKKKYIEAMKNNQLTRALRVDKMTIAALEATLLAYYDHDRVHRKIPTLRMITETYEEVMLRAEGLMGHIDKSIDCVISECESQVGGGTYPLDRIKSACLSVGTTEISAQRLSEKMREMDKPIITRIVSDRVVMDVRTLLEEDYEAVAEAINQLAR
jgi:L-seryl-tRNA(Ser) seleniumtransferase